MAPVSPVARRAPWWHLPLVLAVLVGTVLLGSGLVRAPAAWAHEGVAFPAVQDAITPAPPPGLSVSVVTTSLGSQFVVGNPTSTLMTVLDSSGQEFLRIGPGGVQGNFRSPDWYTTKIAATEGTPAVPPQAGPHQPPLWVTVSRSPQWGWFDERFYPPGLTPPATAQQPEAAFGSWSVPVRFGSTPATITGHFLSQVTLGFTAAFQAPEPVPGVSTVIVPGGSQGILLTNDTATDVVVLGAQGEPFLRIGPGGSDANLRSPTWQSIQAAQGEATDVTPDPAAPPQWSQVSGQHVYAWVDPRPASTLRTSDLALLTRPAVVARWSIPLLVDGRRVDAAGTTTFVPSAAGSTPADGGFAGKATTPLLVGAAVLLAGAFALLYLRVYLRARRRSRSSSPARG